MCEGVFIKVNSKYTRPRRQGKRAGADRRMSHCLAKMGQNLNIVAAFMMGKKILC